jgi:hypothetical protein
MLLPSGSGLLSSRLVKTRKASGQWQRSDGDSVTLLLLRCLQSVRRALPLAGFALKRASRCFLMLWSTVSCDLTFLPHGLAVFSSGS